MDDTDESRPETGAPRSPQKESDRSERWQKIALNQRGYTLNLILTFTVAMIGYWFVLLRDDKFLPGPLTKCGLLMSGLSLALAAVFGFACVLVRLWDIHATARRAGAHPKRHTQAFVRALDCWVLWLFRLHVSFFLFAVATLAAALCAQYGSKLI
jgi:hypothetical protein